MRKRLPVILLGLSSAVWAAGCASPPTERVDAVKAQVQQQAADAQMYAADAYQSAEQAVAALDAELAAQEGGFALTRSYDRAGELADAVETAATDLGEAIADGRERMRAEAGQSIADARAAVADTRQSLEAVAAGDLPQDERSAWEGELAGADAALEEADGLLASDSFTEAQAQARSATGTATQISDSVAAIEVQLEEEKEEAVARAAQGDVTIPRRVLVDGQPLAAGTYRLRVDGEWVEFLRDGAVAGRGLAVVVPDGEVGEIAKSPSPRNEARVVQLKSGEYIRVWLNRGGMNYLLHLPIPSS